MLGPVCRLPRDSTTFAQNVAQRLSTRIHDPARSASAYLYSGKHGNWVSGSVADSSQGCQSQKEQLLLIVPAGTSHRRLGEGAVT